MSRCVPDARVLIKLHIEETGSEQAITAIAGADFLCAPALIWAEVSSVLWKYARRGVIQPTDAKRMLVDMMQMPIAIIPTEELIEDALTMAMETDRSGYDCLYVIAAIESDSVVLTADQRLANALAKSPWAGYVTALSIN